MQHGSSPDCSAASHAHPLPTQPSPSALKEKHIRALIARQTINVALRGLHCEHATTAPDILTPKIRRSPFNRASMYESFEAHPFTVFNAILLTHRSHCQPSGSGRVLEKLVARSIKGTANVVSVLAQVLGIGSTGQPS